MGWVSAGDNRASTLQELPEMASGFETLYRSLWTQHHIPPTTLELCRLRLAQLHRSAVDMRRSDCDIPANQRDTLTHWDSDGNFSAAERACLAFTEVYAMDVQALTDELADAVKSHHGDAGLVLLVEALGILDGMTRLSLLWQLPVSDEPREAGRASA